MERACGLLSTMFCFLFFLLAALSSTTINTKDNAVCHYLHGITPLDSNLTGRPGRNKPFQCVSMLITPESDKPIPFYNYDSTENENDYKSMKGFFSSSNANKLDRLDVAYLIDSVGHRLLNDSIYSNILGPFSMDLPRIHSIDLKLIENKVQSIGKFLKDSIIEIIPSLTQLLEPEGKITKKKNFIDNTEIHMGTLKSDFYHNKLHIASYGGNLIFVNKKYDEGIIVMKHDVMNNNSFDFFPFPINNCGPADRKIYEAKILKILTKNGCIYSYEIDNKNLKIGYRPPKKKKNIFSDMLVPDMVNNNINMWEKNTKYYKFNDYDIPYSISFNHQTEDQKLSFLFFNEFPIIDLVEFDVEINNIENVKNNEYYNASFNISSFALDKIQNVIVIGKNFVSDIIIEENENDDNVIINEIDTLINKMGNGQNWKDSITKLNRKISEMWKSKIYRIQKVLDQVNECDELKNIFKQGQKFDALCYNPNK